MDAIDGIFNYFTGISLIDEGSKLIKSFGDGIVNTWQSIKSSVIDVFTGWIPDWVKSGMKTVGVDVDAVRTSAGLANSSVPTVDAHHANGAIVRRRQIAEIGEDGPEAIIPLTKPARARPLLIRSAEILGLRVIDKNYSNIGSVSPLPSKSLTGGNMGLLSNVITSFDKLVKPQIKGLNNFAKGISSIFTNIKNPQQNNSNQFDNLLLESGKTIIDEMIKLLSKRDNNHSSFSPTFSPNITINCSSNVDEVEKQVQKALRQSQTDFKKSLNDFLYNQKRIGVF